MRLKTYAIITLLSISTILAATSQEFTDENILIILAGQCHPGSGCYAFEKIFDNIKIILTPNKVDKATILSQIADQRIAESLLTPYPEVAEEALEDENAKNTQLDQILSTGLTTQDIMQNTIKIQKLQEHLNNRELILDRIIQRIQSDNNPNNDHALPGLKNALEHAKKNKINLAQTQDTADQDLKLKGLPGLSNIREAMTKSKQEKKPILIDTSGQIKTLPTQGGNY